MPRTASPGAGAALAAALLIPVALLTPGAASAATVGGRGMSATIRYTEYGIPHIAAKDYAGLGYGTGYAAAKDNACLIAQGAVTLRGERSRYFGPSERPDGSLSSASTNLASDAFFTAVNDSGIVERLAAAPAPYGPTEDVRRLSRGWAAGFNRFLREGKITDPACKGARGCGRSPRWTSTAAATRWRCSAARAWSPTRSPGPGARGERGEALDAAA